MLQIPGLNRLSKRLDNTSLSQTFTTFYQAIHPTASKPALHITDGDAPAYFTYLNPLGGRSNETLFDFGSCVSTTAHWK